MDARVNSTGGAVAVAAILAAAQGCVLLDGRTELTVEPAGTTLYGADHVRLRASGACERFTVEVDGKLLAGTFAANADVSVPLGVPSGVHRLVVRAWDGAVAGTSVERRLEVDATPFNVASTSPPPGTTILDAPFSVEVAFSNRIDPSFAPTVYATGLGPTRVTVGADGRSATVSSTVRLDQIAGAGLMLSVLPLGRLAPVTLPVGAWRAPVLDVTVDSPAPGISYAAGPVRFTARATGELPDAAELAAGDRVLATLGAPPWNVVLDPAVLGDGTYSLRIRAPGYRVQGALPTVVLDTTAPRVVRCAPEQSAADQAMPLECIAVELSEPVVGALDTQARLLVNGAPRAARISPLSGGRPGVLLCPTETLAAAALPALETVTLPPLQDLAGHALEPFTCATTVPAWRAPWGSGAAVAGLAASGISIRARACLPAVGATQPDTLLATRTAGGPISVWTSSAATWGPFGTLGAGTATELDGATWIERGEGAPGLVRWCRDPAHTFNRDAARDARHPTGDAGGQSTLAWSEEDPAGGRTVEVWGWGGGDVWYDRGPLPRLDPASIADEPAVSGASSTTGPHVAWIETVPGGVPQVRSARLDRGIWQVTREFVNRDPAAVAAEPAAWGSGSTIAVAWTEGGAALVTMSWYWTVTGPTVLNVDPTHLARRPRFDAWPGSSPIVFWIEQTPAGDEIWARRWNGTGWDLLPGPVNAGAEGATVRALDVSGGTVAWTDDAGVVRIRNANFQL